MKLIITEKPSLGRTVAAAIRGEQFAKKDGYLESRNYIVSWCFGHLYELQDLDKYFSDYDPAAKPKWTLDKLPFYPDGWKFRYEIKCDPKTRKVDAGVRKQIKTLAELMNRFDVDVIYGCGDADNEGQAIVDNVLRYNLKTKKTVLRLWLPALTSDAINEGLRNAKPDSEYRNVYYAALTRADVDWLMGIELTRYASLKANRFVRIGRCVCPIVAQVVEREKSIRDFVPKPYSAVVSKEKTNGEEIELVSKKTFDEGHEAEAQALADKYNAAGATVTDVKTERKKVKPPKLFSMSDLQSYVCKVDKSLSPADVLSATQALYEAAYVTYPRTNSNYLAAGESSKVQAVINALGIAGLSAKTGDKSIYDDSKVESHSALMPTTKKPASLSGTEQTVYNCILKRFCAVFCAEDCTVDRTTITIQCSDETFTLKGDVQVTAGWRKYEKPSSGDKILPRLMKSDKVNVLFKPVGKMTTPPKRYTVESLNNWMKTPMRAEDKPDIEYTDAEWKDILSDATICTEATRADTIERCKQSQYISLKKGVYYAEEAGFFLVDVMASLNIDLGPQKTVELSRDMHKVKEGTMPRSEVLNATKDVLDDIIKSNRVISSTHTAPVAVSTKTALGECPKCGKNVYETPRAFSCEDRNCGFALWKDDKYLSSLGKKMTSSIVKGLLSSNHKAKLTGCTSKKTGKKYDCILHVDFSEKYPKYSITFDAPKKK